VQARHSYSIVNSQTRTSGALSSASQPLGSYGQNFEMLRISQSLRSPNSLNYICLRKRGICILSCLYFYGQNFEMLRISQSLRSPNSLKFICLRKRGICILSCLVLPFAHIILEIARRAVSIRTRIAKRYLIACVHYTIFYQIYVYFFQTAKGMP
jgi:hypothetical protein